MSLLLALVASGQILTAGPVTQDASSSSAAIEQAHALTASANSQGASSGSGLISQSYTLTAGPVEQSANSGSGSIAQIHTLVVGGIVQVNASPGAQIVQWLILSGGADSQTAYIEQGRLRVKTDYNGSDEERLVEALNSAISNQGKMGLSTQLQSREDILRDELRRMGFIR